MDGTGAGGMPPGTKRPRYATTRQKTCHHCAAAKAKCDRGEGGCARCASRGLVCVYPSPQAQQQQSFVNIDVAAGAGAAGPVTAATAHDGRVGNGGGSYYGLEVLSGLAVSEHWTSSSSSSAKQQPVHIPPRPATTTTVVNEPYQLDLRNCSSLLSEELACPVNAEDVRNRWLHPYVPMPGQEAKAYPRNVTAFICRVLSSYAGIVRRGRFRRGGCGVGGCGGRGGVVVPPFIHHGQVCGRDGRGGGEDLPLDTCLRLAKALGDGVGEKDVDREDGKEGGEEEEQEKGTRALGEEMDGVYERHGEYDGVTMLSAFQAYLVYSLILFSQTYTSTSSLSSSSPSPSPSSLSVSVSASSRALLRQAMMNLQDLASSSIRQGIVLLPLHHHQQQPHHRASQRPSWEAWVAAEAKRRALYTMYLFDSALSSLDDLPTFLGTELRGLPAPAGGSMWAAGSREAWGAAYDDCVADWGEEKGEDGEGGEGGKREEGEEGEEREEREGDGGFLRIEELWPATTDAAGLARRERRIGRWLEDADEFGMMLYAVTCGTHGV